MVINISQMAQISGKESVLIVKVEDHKHFSLGRDIKKDDSELDWTLKHLQSRKSEQRLLRVSELLIFLILYMKQFSNNESTIKLVRAGEKLHSKIWGTFVAVLMADQEAKIIIMSISSNCLKNWIYLM